MILRLIVGGFFGMLHSAQVMRVRQVGVMAGLLVKGGTEELGSLPVVSSRFLEVFRCCVVVHCAWLGN